MFQLRPYRGAAPVPTISAPGAQSNQPFLCMHAGYSLNYPPYVGRGMQKKAEQLDMLMGDCGVGPEIAE